MATQSAAIKKDFSLPFIVAASSAGTVIEWYDFYIYATLASFLAAKFFPHGNPTVAFLQALGVYAVGFVVRPFGAVIFGAIGDVVGRKFTFLLTLSLMGIATFIIGCLPDYDTIGILAPVILVLLRSVQGLALGGEYGGAATYVAEHAPDHHRGLYTSWIQTTATVGLFVSIAVILSARLYLGDKVFADWGWRVPFLLSIVLVALAIYIRLKLQETPLFARMKSEGKTTSTPMADTYGSGKNWRLMALALLGATAGQGVVWYTGQFYVLLWMQRPAPMPGVDFLVANIVVAIAVALATPFFIFFGWLSDKIGRKVIILTGCAIAVVTYYPIYFAIQKYAALPADPGPIAMLVLLVFIQVIYVTMVYGPIAAFLVELFPLKVRYSSMSIPYHIGNGVFGGLLPLIGFSLIAETKNPMAGLWYPMAVATMTLIVGAIFIRETKDTKIWDEAEGRGFASTMHP